jgi:hypothetical protein
VDVVIFNFQGIGCYEIDCRADNKFRIRVGSSRWVACDNEGQTATVSGFRGKIICPSFDSVCDGICVSFTTVLFNCLAQLPVPSVPTPAPTPGPTRRPTTRAPSRPSPPTKQPVQAPSVPTSVFLLIFFLSILFRRLTPSSHLQALQARVAPLRLAINALTPGTAFGVPQRMVSMVRSSTRMLALMVRSPFHAII